MAKIPMGKFPYCFCKPTVFTDTFSLTSVNYCLFGWRETLLCLTAAPLLSFLLGPKLWNLNGKVDAAHGPACGLRRVLLNCSTVLLRRCRPGHFHLHIAPLWKHGINHRILLKSRNETRQIRWLADSMQQIKALSLKQFALSLMKWVLEGMCEWAAAQSGQCVSLLHQLLGQLWNTVLLHRFF